MALPTNLALGLLLGMLLAGNAAGVKVITIAQPTAGLLLRGSSLLLSWTCSSVLVTHVNISINLGPATISTMLDGQIRITNMPPGLSMLQLFPGGTPGQAFDPAFVSVRMQPALTGSEMRSNGTVPASVTILYPRPGSMVYGERVGVSWQASFPFFSFVVVSVDNNPGSMVIGAAADNLFLSIPRPGPHRVRVEVYANNTPTGFFSEVNFTSNVSVMVASPFHEVGPVFSSLSPRLGSLFIHRAPFFSISWATTAASVSSVTLSCDTCFPAMPSVFNLPPSGVYTMPARSPTIECFRLTALALDDVALGMAIVCTQFVSQTWSYSMRLAFLPDPGIMAPGDETVIYGQSWVLLVWLCNNPDALTARVSRDGGQAAAVVNTSFYNITDLQPGPHTLEVQCFNAMRQSLGAAAVTVYMASNQNVDPSMLLPLFRVPSTLNASAVSASWPSAVPPPTAAPTAPDTTMAGPTSQDFVTSTASAAPANAPAAMGFSQSVPVVLFDGWTANHPAGYWLTLISLFIISCLFESLCVILRVDNTLLPDDDSPSSSAPAPLSCVQRGRVQLVLGSLLVPLRYGLMLVAVMLNAGLILAIVLGGALGHVVAQVLAARLHEQELEQLKEQQSRLGAAGAGKTGSGKDDAQAVQEEILMRGLDGWIEPNALSSRESIQAINAAAAAEAFRMASTTTRYPSVACMDYKEVWCNPRNTASPPRVTDRVGGGGSSSSGNGDNSKPAAGSPGCKEGAAGGGLGGGDGAGISIDSSSSSAARQDGTGVSAGWQSTNFRGERIPEQGWAEGRPDARDRLFERVYAEPKERMGTYMTMGSMKSAYSTVYNAGAYFTLPDAGAAGWQKTILEVEEEAQGELVDMEHKDIANKTFSI